MVQHTKTVKVKNLLNCIILMAILLNFRLRLELLEVIVGDDVSA